MAAMRSSQPVRAEDILGSIFGAFPMFVPLNVGEKNHKSLIKKS